MAYTVRNPRTHKANEQLPNYPWFIPTCSNRNDAKRILESCQTIENGNFLVRRSENKNTKYTITLWFDKTVTHVRINQLDNGQYQLEFNPNSMFQIPTFSTLKQLIDFYSDHDVKLIGHCQGHIRLKFNSNIFNSLK